MVGEQISAQTTQATTLPAPSADFELHEWAIFVAEPLAPRVNAVAAIKSTLPSFVVSRRPDADPNERMNVMPIGVIRILGGKTPSPKFDVLLNLKGGEFQGHWPKAENNRNNRLLWSNLIADETKPALSQLDAKHWLNRLREPESRYLTAAHDSRGERFLLYDAEPTFNMPLKVEASGESGYRVTNSGSTDVLKLELYKSKTDGWHSAFVANLAGGGAAPSTKPATGPSTRPSAVPSTAPSGKSLDMPLSPSAVSDSKQLLSAWKDRLASTGLAPLDTDLVLDILAKYAIDPGRLTAVYMLDQKQMDDLLPEEVVPTPAKTVRVGLVVVRNIDPQINDEIAQLVKQLGDDEWSRREEAQKKLTTFGRAAKNAVEKATKEKDLEVVWRAEAVLRTIDPQKFQPQVPQ